MTYGAERLHAEVAYVAYHLHWPLDDIIDLEHGDRVRFVTEINRLNRDAQEGW